MNASHTGTGTQVRAPYQTRITHQIIQQLRVCIKFINKPAQSHRPIPSQSHQWIILALQRIFQEVHARVCDGNPELDDNMLDTRREVV